MNARILMISPILLLVAAGCGTEWKGADNDGDGQSAADGDCWDAAEGPVAGISGADIFAGAKDAWYDGVDANCAGDDDFDADLDGFVPEEHVGRKTFGLADSGALPGGDCLDSPDEGFADRLGSAASDDPIAAFTAVDGFDQPLPSAVFPGADDLLYDDVDADCAGEDADGNGAADDFDADLDGFTSAVMARRDGSLGDDCAEGAPGEDPDVNRADLPLDDIFPGATDSPYDGTDADCSGVDVNDDGVLDDCDLDLDGGAFDDADDGEDDGCVVRDCDDTDATAVPDPTVAEVPYDGVDNNCLLTLDDGTPDNDGDADRDGFWAADYRDRVPSPDDTVGPLPATFDDCWDDPDALPAGWVEQPVMAFDPTADWESASTLAYDDAVTAAATFPGALDRPYDTIDQDCAGEDANSDGVLDDMDWDGDGYPTLYQSGGDTFGDDCLDCAADCEGASGALADICGVVCDNDAYLGLADEDNLTNRGLLDSDEVNPDALEEWGDGTDADCDRSSDFDQDKDFYAGRDYGDGEPWAFEEERVYYYSDGATLSGGGDCNDEVLAIRPGAVDAWYDGVDQNCGDNDDFDADADGYVPTTYVGRTTAHGTGTPTFGGALPGDDCNDTDATFNPGRTDAWYDGLDSDCADNDDYDQDVDRYVQTVHGALSTSQGAGTTPFGGALPTDDCNDTQSTVNPGRADTWYDGIDSNCSDNDDHDADADGYVPTAYVGRTTSFGSGVATTFGGALPGDDCNDTLASVRPGLPDAWYDGVDTDCADNDDYDQDADGHVRVADASRSTSYGAGVSTTFGGALPANDCDDTNAVVYGGATTDVWYDGVDTDCAGNDDYDVDADGYASLARAGSYGPTTYVTGSGALPTTDCNDTVSTVNPGRADTWYDGVDSNCGNNDDYDRDADGYVQTIHGSLSTNQGTGSASFGGALPTDDCNDTLSTVRPGLTDTWYDGVDTNCSDNDDHDADADGYVPTAYASRVTSYGAGSALASFGGALPSDDCNDAVVGINPGATDAWYDGVDTNCSDNDDYDADADNYVPTIYVSRTTSHGTGTSTFGTLKPGDDCNDTLSTVNPGRTDTWYDGVDSDCSDNDDYDRDLDGRVRAVDLGRTTSFGAGVSTTFGGSLPANDCDDTNATVYGGSTDTWYDGVDSDCSGNDDYDRDADGYARIGTYGATTYVSGSGSLPVTDCNDGVSTVNPGRTDTWYDGTDSNCGGNDDYDRDGDGYVQTIHGSLTTSQGTGSTAFGGSLPTDDCNDTLSTIRPGLTDTWYDGVDTNCSDNDDYDRDADAYVQTIHVGLSTSYGAGSALSSFGGALPGDDCNDTLNTIRPGLTDTWYDGVDTNCSDNDDHDRDGDGYVQTIHAGRTTSYGAGSSLAAFGGALPSDDCNDTLNTIRPGLTDAWYDGVDTNCSDNDDYDQDADGFVRTVDVGRVTSYGAGSALASFGGALPGNDCNDIAAAIRPSATEICDGGVDNDCDSLVDDADPGRDSSTGTLSYRDADSDTYGNLAVTTRTCTVPTGYVTNSLDCNDASAAINPLAAEVCDSGVDNDCDSLADDADPGRTLASTTTFYRDADSDTYGNLSVTSRACVAPSGYVSNDDDCNDAAAAVNPGATEVCDSGVDNNCNGSSDDADGTLSLASRLTFYRDLDTDTYGNVAVSSLACAAPAGYVGNPDDCDDANLNINPGEDEVCDPADVDEDCSLTADDADPGVTGTFTTFYRDVDGDTYGNLAVTDDRCDAGGGYVSNDDDCNDGAAAIKPGATEVCDTVDNDCDALIDDADPGVSGSLVTYYRDADGDGQGTTTPTATAVCSPPAGYAVSSTDCDDTRAAVYLGAPEICDSLDNDCDSLTDDADTLAGGAGTLTYMDDDLDDYGDELDASPVRYCVVPTDRATNNTDCDDSAAGVHPGEPEIEDGIDQDCDDYVDEGGFIGVESIRITEFMYNPDPPADTDAEWVELYNPGTVDVVVGPGWRFTENGSSLTMTALNQFVVPANGYALIVKTTNSATNGAIPIVTMPQPQYVVWSAMALGNSGSTGDTITITYDDPDVVGGAVTIDVVNYLINSGGWPTAAGAAGYGIQLSNDGATAPPTYPANNNIWASYCLSTATYGTPSQFGTPGAVNRDCTP